MAPVHYEETAKTVLDHMLEIQKDLRYRSVEPYASPAVGDLEKF